jgi:nitrite reductase/ring-hydroxylating ferredoxin subunit
MRRAKTATAVEELEAIVDFAGDLPAREIEIIKPFSIQGEKGERLAWGSRYVVSGKFAALLIACGQAFDVRTGERRATPKAETPEPPRRSGRTVRVRVLNGFSFEIDGGRIVGPGEEFDAPIEQLRTFGQRVERLDLDRRPERKIAVTGEPHPVRITAGGPGCGIWSVALDRHVEHNEEITVPDSEAGILIAIGRAVSLIPEKPSAAALEFAEIIAGDDEEKRDRVATLAHRILKGRNS